MFAIRTFLALALASVALANPLEVRQATNTNAAINTVIDQLDSLVRNQVFTIGRFSVKYSLTSSTSTFVSSPLRDVASEPHRYRRHGGSAGEPADYWV